MPNDAAKAKPREADSLTDKAGHNLFFASGTGTAKDIVKKA